jgi:hypothetical protein
MTEGSVESDKRVDFVEAVAAVLHEESVAATQAKRRWRQHVATAAANEGKVPREAVAEVIADAKILGVEPERFSADVSAYLRDRDLAEAIADAESRAATLAIDIAKASEEIAVWSQEFSTIKSDRDSQLRKLEQAMTEKRRAAEKNEASLRRLQSATARLHDQQMQLRGGRDSDRLFGRL